MPNAQNVGSADLIKQAIEGFITLPIAEKHLTTDKKITTKEEDYKLEKLASALKTQNEEITRLNPKSYDVSIGAKKIERMAVFNLKRARQKLAEFQFTRSRGALT